MKVFFEDEIGGLSQKSYGGICFCHYHASKLQEFPIFPILTQYYTDSIRFLQDIMPCGAKNPQKERFFAPNRLPELHLLLTNLT